MAYPKPITRYEPTTTIMNDSGAHIEVGYKAKPVSMYRARRKMVQTDNIEGV